MPVRFRITILFSFLVFLILGLVCGGIYYSSYEVRIKAIQNRLTIRALNTARLLSRSEVFNQRLVLQIDSLRTVTYAGNVIEAYDQRLEKVYSFTDRPGDTVAVAPGLLREAMNKGQVYFISGKKEAVAYYYNDPRMQLVLVSAGEDSEGKQNLVRLRRLLILAFLAGNALVLIAGYIFSYRLLRPVRRITADVAEISAHNLARRLEAGHPRDEWSRLANTLNDLLNRLQESFEMQRRFISNASHELSTPLTSISSQLEVALLRERAAGDYRQVMSSIYQDVQHMSKLTQTLLEFAKASGDAGGLDIRLIRVDEVLLRLPAAVSKADAAYSMTLHFEEVPEDAARLLVYGNEALLFTAFQNMVLNACKYSPNHQARVILESADRELLVKVCDDGVGIPPEHIGQIFQPFFRVEENLQGGFGLGLPLARRIIGLHKGHIEVSSAPGKGTCFAVRLPPAYEPGTGPV
ncbi:HAMP domain-containing histidine kinase [Flaviaesturariibacter flavus]|uniref:histidine kinase n=1 Tax=Flaviaesturariibacter flavus TaxID=2502780 RepID=A0A4R1B6R7_9BACT|nr:HAMP domain-containing sensor histidine kinase [Flaviaesturariibacter flavus]TCJ12437.1 HAMP domain-containing histidine kinase [Flaviaesturariibacter flavus]